MTNKEVNGRKRSWPRQLARMMETTKKPYREGSGSVETQTAYLQVWPKSRGASLSDAECSKA
jgi:hypothetical protein